MTHTRQSDKVLGTEKSLPHARRSLVDPPVLVLSLARGKKDDHMLETLNIIGFESIMIMVIASSNLLYWYFSCGSLYE